jgi:hypothetical protein
MGRSEYWEAHVVRVARFREWARPGVESLRRAVCGASAGGILGSISVSCLLPVSSLMLKIASV